MMQQEIDYCELRCAQGWTIRDVVAITGLSAHTILRIERGQRVKPGSLLVLSALYGPAGVGGMGPSSPHAADVFKEGELWA